MKSWGGNLLNRNSQLDSSSYPVIEGSDSLLNLFISGDARDYIHEPGFIPRLE
jgi:hypothetical protein